MDGTEHKTKLCPSQPAEISETTHVPPLCLQKCVLHREDVTPVDEPGLTEGQMTIPVCLYHYLKVVTNYYRTSAVFQIQHNNISHSVVCLYYLEKIKE